MLVNDKGTQTIIYEDGAYKLKTFTRVNDGVWYVVKNTMFGVEEVKTPITTSGLYCVEVVVAGTTNVVYSATFYITVGVEMGHLFTLYYDGQANPAVISFTKEGNLVLTTKDYVGYYDIGKIRLVSM